MWQTNHCVVQQGMHQTRQCKKYFDWRAEAVLLIQPGRHQLFVLLPAEPKAVMPLNFLSKLLFPRLQPTQRWYQLKTIMPPC
jgi:hypothetical protein